MDLLETLLEQTHSQPIQPQEEVEGPLRSYQTSVDGLIDLLASGDANNASVNAAVGRMVCLMDNLPESLQESLIEEHLGLLALTDRVLGTETL